MRSNTHSEGNSEDDFLTTKERSGDGKNACEMGQNVMQSGVSFLLKPKLHFKGSVDI